jgi:phosphohistidine phosphatase
MKRVYLLRHGKTEKESESGEDFDRKLKPNGEQEVAAAAEKLADGGTVFDRIITSSAPRAAASARIAAEKLSYGADPDARDELYDAEREEVQQLLQSLDDSAETVMLVGHNPSLEETVEAFLGKHRKIGTGNIMWLELDCTDWKELTFETTVLRSGLIMPA